ncbi:MAG: hypothetical protein HDQ97_01960 [Lachnospiraceae bacterium]|nr:hypothetical protein [Lachnospiraceae bacterium]
MNDLSDKTISEIGLSNIKRKKCQSLSNAVIIADYMFKKTNTAVAKYIIVHCDYDEFLQELCRDSIFYQEIVHKCFFEFHNTDLCWNMYQICVMDDEKYRLVPTEEMMEYEANTNYTRKLLIPLSKIETTIPVGKIKEGSKIKAEDIISPKSEWNAQLKKSMLEFCGEEYNEEILMKYLETGSSVQNETKEQKRYKKYNIDKILDITIPKNFRQNCFNKSRRFEFGRVNMFIGKNGSGKTSILEGIELVITGNVRKAMGTYKSYEDVTAINCRINTGQKISKPRKPEEILRRTNSWYHKMNTEEQTLNSEFHLYNYFTAVDTFILSYLGDKRNLSRQFFQVLFGEESLSYYENIEKYLESVSSFERIEKERFDKEAKEISIYQSKEWEIKFFDAIKKFPVIFDQSWDIEEIAQIVKECLRLCRQVGSKDKTLSLTNLLQDEKEIQKQKEEIEQKKSEISLCQTQINAYKHKLKQLREKWASEPLNRKNISNEIDQYGKSLEEIERKQLFATKNLSFKQGMLNTYEESTNKVEQVNALYRKASEIIDMSSYSFRISEINNICLKLNELLNQSQWSLEREKNNLNKINYQRSNELLSRLTNIKNCLSSLHKPEFYLEKYVGNNIKKISDLFLLLQSPKEYEGLAFNEGVELVGVRNNEKIPLHMMSSGQRVAAVMALFFCVHMSADCIPNIILLDEPISHIDELNILALFDLLRELVIRYDKQLFFTTSTKEVGKLFERKFSFLEKDYKKFQFERKGNTETKITT